MEVINPSKAALARKRSAAQQAPQPAPQHSFEPLKLERVFGSGSCAAPAIASPHPVIPGLLAYSCGAVVVLYDSQHKQQTAFFSPKPRRSLVTGKPYACLAFSRDGAYLAAGERSSQSPEILVWEVSSSRCLQALRGHKHGVGSIAFSSDGRLLVSTGESYDGQLCVWDWQAGVLLARQHTQAEVQRACFTEDLAAGVAGLTITTVGKSGHFKVWSLALPAGRGREGNLAAGQASLTPRPASLKEYRSSNFVAVAASPAEGSSSQAQALLYALTQNGVLLTLRPATRTIDKSLSLQVPAAFGLAVSSGLIACACAAGVVRLFATRTLAFKGNLPRPSTGRSTGGGPPDAAGSGGGMGPGPGALGADPGLASAGALFPDAVGCAFDATGERLTVVYTDRSLMVWDVRNPARVARMRSVLSHAGVVWSAALIPPWQAVLMGGQPTPAVSGTPGGAATESFGPSSVLCTCGADGTVRLWNVCLNNSASTAGPLGVPVDMAGAAKVTRTLRAIIYACQPALTDSCGSGAAAAANQRYAPDAPLPAPGGGGQAAKPVALRCLRVSPCGRHLATGDARGNLRVFSLATLQQVIFKEAHDAEILSLDYSPPSLDGACYLASGSRDTFVHVFDMSRGYELVGTCDAHSGAVTAVRFSTCGSRLALLSCSADKSVVFRLVQLGHCGLSFELYHTERMSRGVLYDMAVDPAGCRAVAVGQDNQFRLFDVATGKAIKNFSGDSACGEAVSLAMDPSGHLAICSCTDGSVAVYDVDAGSLLARGSGHSEMCTGAVLLEDHRGLVSVGGDGCALLWRLSPRLAQRMQDAAAECRRELEQQAATQAVKVKERQLQLELEQPALQQPGLSNPQDVTPAVRRRKAWDLGGAAREGVSAGGAKQPEDADAAADAEPQEGDDAEEPQQVHVDMSATLLRIREGKPLLSLEKLPKWAQRTASPMAGYYVVAGDFEGPAIPDAGTTAPTAPSVPALAGVWAQRAAMPPPLPPAAPDPQATLPPAEAEVAAAPPVAVSELPEAFTGSAAAAAAARTGALAGQPRTWAEMIEEDDEIVFCDSLEDGPLLLGDAQPDVAPVEHELQDLDQEAAVAPAAADIATDEPPSAAAAAAEASHEGAGDSTHNAERGDAAPAVLAPGREVELRREELPPAASPRSPPMPQQTDGEEQEGLASGCASNRVGEPPLGQEAPAGDGDAVRRDLFREHFDSLGLDQASATKAPPPDPRRMSFTHMYRQARASSGAGGFPDGSTTPMRAMSGAGIRVSAAGGAVAAAPPPGGAPGALPTTPFASRLPAPPGVNALRGNTAYADADGAVTSAIWTPDPAMLALKSPALARTEKQLQELERIRLRLLSTLRKRQTNEEAALRGANPTASPAPAPPLDTALLGDAPPPVTSAAGAPVGPALGPANAQAAGPAVLLGQPGPDPSAAAAVAAAAPRQPPQQQPADAAARNDTDSQQSREPAQSAGGFLLPPPPAYTPAAPPQRPGPAGGIVVTVPGEQQPLAPNSPAAACQPSPGFSSLSAGTPMMGQGGSGDAYAAPPGPDGHAAFACGDDAGNRLFVFNPIYGASPTTPLFGPGAPSGSQRSFRAVSPRVGAGGLGIGGLMPLSIAGDAGPASSPAESESAAPTTDDVIRAVLESEGGAAAATAAAADAGGGVCVITKDGSGTGSAKELERQTAPATASEAAQSALTVPAVEVAAPSPRGEPGASPAKGSLQRRSKLALPPMKPKLTSPDKSPRSARGLSSLPSPRSAALTGPQATSALVMAAAQSEGVGLVDGGADALLERMQSAVRDFASAYRRLLDGAAASSTAPSPRGGGVAGRFHAVALGAMAELSGLIKAQENAPTSAREQEQQLAAGQYPHVHRYADKGAEDVPPAVMCHSPLVSLEMPSSGRRVVQGSRFGWLGGGTAAAASVSMVASGAAAGAAASSGCVATSSSQVVVEVGGLVESMVEEKLQLRMQQEMQRVEDAVMQRIMQKMLLRQQQQQQ